VRAYRTIRNELSAYGHGLRDKTEIIALNKVDALEKSLASRKQKALEKASGKPVFLISGVSGEGIAHILHALARDVGRERARRRKPERADAWTP
jgi:GTP-binding protein